MAIVADLEQNRQPLHRRITNRDTVPQESPHRSQDPIDSARAAYRRQSRTHTQRLRVARRALEPGHERAQPLCRSPPVPIRPLAPPQIQRHPPRPPLPRPPPPPPPTPHLPHTL